MNIKIKINICVCIDVTYYLSLTDNPTTYVSNYIISLLIPFTYIYNIKFFATIIDLYKKVQKKYNSILTVLWLNIS